MDTACTTVIVDTSCSYIFIPTAFTPNNDGLNDQISINNTCKIDRLIFRIFNRWGQLVFESRNVNDKWDGTFKGEPQPVSTFHYYLEADLINGRKVRQRGDITLIR
jgi:gliding motility-associated-like protein